MPRPSQGAGASHSAPCNLYVATVPPVARMPSRMTTRNRAFSASMRPWFVAGISALFLALDHSPARAGILVTLEAPKVQATQVSGTTVVTFDAVTTGRYTSLSTAIGTYTSPGMQIVASDQFGGADKTRYFSVGAQSAQTTATLTLSATAAYFGFLWCAGDAQNNLDFYMNGIQIATFNTGTLLNFIAGSSNSSQYMGNPNTGQNTAEPYAFVNFFADGGTTFDKIVFRNNGTSTGFESDNHTIRAAAVNPPTGTVVTSIVVAPEPSTWFLALAALGLTGVRALRRRRAA